MDPVFQNNVILTKTESLTMNSRPKDPKTARNKNVLVIGGSGSGKTRFWLKPNLMQMHSSYVVTDPKGTILVECGKMLQRGAPKLGKDGKPMKDKHGKVIYEPYRIKVLNTINFRKSMHYNPFAYTQGLNKSQNKGHVQSDQAAADLLHGRSAYWRTAFLFAQKTYRKQCSGYVYDAGYAALLYAGYVRKAWPAVGKDCGQYHPRHSDPPQAAPLPHQ